MDIFEPIGEALVINGFTKHNSEIQLYLMMDQVLFIIIVSLFILSLYYK